MSKEVERIEAEEAAARAAEEAEALAMAEAEAAGEEYVPAAAAPVTAAAPAYTPAPKAAVGEEARVIDAISRSPLMLTLPAGTDGLSQVAALDDAMIVASCVLLMRVEGYMDAKSKQQQDVTVSSPRRACACTTSTSRGRAFVSRMLAVVAAPVAGCPVTLPRQAQKR